MKGWTYSIALRSSCGQFDSVASFCRQVAAIRQHTLTLKTGLEKKLQEFYLNLTGIATFSVFLTAEVLRVK